MSKTRFLRLPTLKRLCVLAGSILCLNAEDAAIVCNPNRPTFSSSAATTVYQTTEIEYGLQLQSGTYSQPLLIKQGLLPKLEFRLGYSGCLHGDAGSNVSAGLQVRSDPDRYGLSEAIQYMHTFPSSQHNLGSGIAQDSMAFILSQDFLGSIHIDVNLVRQQEAGSLQTARSLSTSYALTSKWSLGCEFYTLSQKGSSDRITSNLWSLTWKLSPQTVVDTAVDIGLTPSAPKYTIIVGVTHNLGHVF